MGGVVLNKNMHVSALERVLEGMPRLTASQKEMLRKKYEEGVLRRKEVDCDGQVTIGQWLKRKDLDGLSKESIRKA